MSEPAATDFHEDEPATVRTPGLWQGQVTVHDDFDELPENVMDAFRGEAP